MKRRSKATKKAKVRPSIGRARKAVAKAKSSKKSQVLRSKQKRRVEKSHKQNPKSRSSSRVPRVKIPPGQSMVSEPLEQVIVTCANCSRQFTVVKLPGLSMEGMICQRCELGEIEFPE